MKAPTVKYKRYGFTRASTFLTKQINGATQTRGFAISKLLINWSSVVSKDIADACKPVRITYPTKGIGATLSVLTRPSLAPIIQMQIPQMIEQVNACYGYRAINRIQVTQTASYGFGENASKDQVETSPPHPYRDDKGTNISDKMPSEHQDKMQKIISGIENKDLRDQVMQLGEKILNQSK